MAAIAGVLFAGAAAASPGFLRPVADLPLPGRPTRFDYQSLDPAAKRLYVAHWGDGEVVVVDLQARRVAGTVPGFPHNTGVLAVPEANRVFASAGANHAVGVIDPATLQILAWYPGGRYPDGLAWCGPRARLYVSDGGGGTVSVIDVAASRTLPGVNVGGKLGNSRYDPVGGLVWVNVRTQGQLVAIDPATDAVVRRYALPDGGQPQGLLIDGRARAALVACKGTDRLLVVSLTDGRVVQSLALPPDPDVLSLDGDAGPLYVACESGWVAGFARSGSDGRRVSLGRMLIGSNAHSVCVDPATHLVYLPLKNVDGRPVLRIMEPTPPAQEVAP